MLYEYQTSRTIVYDHRLIAGTMGIIFAAVSQCCPSESGVAGVLACGIWYQLADFVSMHTDDVDESE